MDRQPAGHDVDGTLVVAIEGDLTRQEVDGIVNAANVHLRHGGGVAGAIVLEGGREIQDESDAWVAEHGPLRDGVAAVTTAGDLRARRVIHTAGPVFDPDRDDNERRLRAAVTAALEAARTEGLRRVAVPAISAGIYGYPPDDACRAIAEEIVAHIHERPGSFDEIRLVGYDGAAARRFETALAAAVTTIYG